MHSESSGFIIIDNIIIDVLDILIILLFINESFGFTSDSLGSSNVTTEMQCVDSWRLLLLNGVR